MGMIDLIVIAVLILAAVISATVVVLPPVSFAYVVTACGILLTWRIQNTQAKLAERKLFLELMQRRAEWYDRVKLALEGRSQERRDQVEVILTGKMPDNPEHLSKLWQLETEASWLFGKEMVILMANMIEADNLLYGKMMAAREGDFEAAKECSTFAWDVSNKQSRVQEYLSDYLYVGDIGKPKQSPVKFMKEKRRGPLGLLPPRRPTRP
jgi:hypothetical protein